MRSEGKKRTLELSLIQGFSKIEKLFGGATRNRTGDTRIFSPLLYQLSYRAKLREQDLNLRPSGYEPDELPTAPPRDGHCLWNSRSTMQEL